jgi:hypothetical protein
LTVWKRKILTVLKAENLSNQPKNIFLNIPKNRSTNNSIPSAIHQPKFFVIENHDGCRWIFIRNVWRGAGKEQNSMEFDMSANYLESHPNDGERNSYRLIGAWRICTLQLFIGTIILMLLLL